MPKLIKSLIDQSQPKDKNYFVWDTEVKGFGCRILIGGKKTYVFYYHSPVTKKKTGVKIGVHGNMTVDLARTEAKKLSAAVASGNDPREQKQEKIMEQKQAMLFEDFFQIFKEKYITVAYKDKGYSNMNVASVHLLPRFGQQRLDTITSKDIKLFLESLRHIPSAANRSFSLLSVLFKKAEEWEYLPLKSNPCIGVSRYKENKKQRFLSRHELLKLEEALHQQEQERPHTYYLVNALRLALYTGCRRGNILNLKWENVHLKERYIHLPDTKTGESAIPVNMKAHDLLASLKRQTNNDYVFPGRVSGKPLIDINKTWKQILKRAGIKDFRVHDLRHSFASLSLSQGVDLYTVSKLLGHKNIATTTRYAHLELEKLKDATNKMAEVFG